MTTDREQFEAMKRAAFAKYGLRFDQIKDPAIREDFESGFNAGVEWQSARAAPAQPAGEKPVITLVVTRGKPMQYKFHRDVWGYGEYDLYLKC